MVATKSEETPREKFELDWARMRLAHEGMMLEKIQRQNRIVEQLAAQTRDGKFTGGPVPSVPEDENMGVSVGNETHNHYGGGETKSLGSLGKLIVAASLLAGGAGAGVVVNQLLPSAPPAAVDTDTVTDVTFPGVVIERAKDVQEPPSE